jgi:hypothetical protein
MGKQSYVEDSSPKCSTLDRMSCIQLKVNLFLPCLREAVCMECNSWILEILLHRWIITSFNWGTWKNNCCVKDLLWCSIVLVVCFPLHCVDFPIGCLGHSILVFWQSVWSPSALDPSWVVCLDMYVAPSLLSRLSTCDDMILNEGIIVHPDR